ncbi:MAG: TonB-dependent receptor [Melioribacteraceae bacterium]|nr:TonB-dependent receptor [Melioribacteraceae bacterium]
MNRIFIALLIFFVWLSGSLFAHTGRISGRIVDSLSNAPMAYVNILLESTGIGIFSDNKGNFLLQNVPEGKYKIKFSYVGYITQEKEIVVVADSEVTLLIKMQQTTLDLSDITVVSQLKPHQVFTNITKIDIELKPINSSQDVLRLLPGLITAQHAGGGKAEQIFLRGFDIDHGTDIDISVDGIPVNMVTHAHGQGYADLHFVIPELIESVDFNKGPYYTDHGNFNTTGYVNFKTKTNVGNDYVKFEFGDFKTFRTVALIDLLGKMHGDQNAYIAAEFLYSDSYFEAPQNFNRINLFGKYSGKISKDNAFTISLSNFSSKWDHSGQIPNRAVEDYGWITRFGAIDDTEGGNTSRFNINTELITEIDNKTFLTNQIYYTKYDFQLWSNFTLFLRDTTNMDQIFQNEVRNIAGYRGSYTTSGYIGNLKLSSIAGWGIRYDAIKDLELSHTVNRKNILSTPSLGIADETNFNIFYDGTLNITDNLILNFGLRYDHFIFDYIDDTQEEYTSLSDNACIFSPKLSLFYNVSQDLQLYLKSGFGFHSNDTRVILENRVPEALPRAIGSDLGLFYKPIPTLLLNFALWTIYMESELVYVGDEAVIEPSDETMRYGVDFSVRYQIIKDLFFDFDYNYSYGYYINEHEGENYIPLAPNHTSMCGITYKPLQGLGGSLRYRYVGDRPANEDNSVVALGYFLLDASVYYKWHNIELYLRAENILNEEWNEAQFDTESRLRAPDENGDFTGPLEPAPISELSYTPGYPIYLRGGVILNF